MINGPTSGAIAAVSNVILQLFNMGSSSVGNGNAATTPGDTGPVDGVTPAGLV
ncbi:hypothetical protein [Tomitella gaofuii]|uniref:hypothetical protein n=1 Tax=Tomitella gaofuii TaxID=2760083 RepID=UPI0015F98D23|nr:hypothetical protein [Tomitella gaofuii]